MQSFLRFLIANTVLRTNNKFYGIFDVSSLYLVQAEFFPHNSKKRKQAFLYYDKQCFCLYMLRLTYICQKKVTFSIIEFLN